MVTFNFQKLLHDGDRFLLYSKGVCMSGDEKPTEGIANGSELLEMDTSTKYKFNLANSQWVKVVGDCCGLAEEINRLSAIVPDPTSADTGKVLTASGEGTGSWEQASGGGGTATPVFRVNGDLYSESSASLTHVSGPTEEEIRARYAEGEVFPIAILYTPVYLTNEAVIFSESATYEPGDGDRVQPRVDFYFPGIATGPEAEYPLLNTDAGFTIALARGIVVVIQDSGGYAYKIANTNNPVEPGDSTGATPPVALFFNTIQD